MEEDLNSRVEEAVQKLMKSRQSQPPCLLSMFLEVTDSRKTSSDWSCFVSHRLSVVNQKMEVKSVSKESQNRYSKAAKDWGWREFVTLTSLFDQDSGVQHVAEGNANEPFGVQKDYFTSVLGRAETLALSRDPCVKDL
ncbi:hypothetical protein K1719_021593 [Acacia pycnantha]|nr:hypothetical protein K1719_021593 [Acacia pycnantha]